MTPLDQLTRVRQMTLDSLNRILDLQEAMSHPCETCGGLPVGLPPQCYDDIVECTCPVCPECQQRRPGDERVEDGMKCSFCAYRGE